MKSVRIIERTRSAYSYPLLIKNLLYSGVLYFPDHEIVYRDLLRYTYRDFVGRVNRLASALTELGVGPGDTVAVLDWDSHRYLECFFAVPMMGAVLHTVNVRLSPEQILYTMNHAEDTIVLVNEDFVEMLEGIASELRTVKAYVLLSDRSKKIKGRLPIVGEYEDLLAKASPDFQFEDFSEDAQATVFYTTGTTGDPKGVYYSHRQLVLHTLGQASLGSMALQAPFHWGDVYMPITPMFHVHAWGFPYMATMIGAKQVYPGRYEPEMLLKLIEKEGVTYSHCVPTILHMLLEHPLASKIDLSKWKVVIGGAAYPRGLARKALQMGINTWAGYGMSETCPVLTTALLKPHMLDWDMERQLEFRIKTGIPLPLVHLRIADESGNPLPRDGRSSGEIVVRAPWLTQGYLKDPQRSEELWRGGWLHTGDIAFQDEEGYVKITDRLKDVIKTGGEWISSLELESLISQHEAVSEVAVIGQPHEKWGERPVALVVLREGAKQEETERSIREFLGRFVEKGTISKWWIPDRIVFVDEIPKTSVGKINKKEIRKRFTQGV